MTMNRTFNFITRLVCIDDNANTIRVLDPNEHILTECFLNTYVQLPTYIAWALALGYQFGRAADMPRHIRHSTLVLLRLIATLLLVISIVDICLNYYLTNLYPIDNDPEHFTSRLILQFTRSFVFGLNACLIYNRNVFARVFPVSLVVTLYALTLGHLVEFGNRIYAAQKLSLSFDQMQMFEKYEVLKATFQDALLFGYLLTVSATFRFESIRVLDIVSADYSHDPRLSGRSEEDEASYLSYLSFG